MDANKRELRNKKILASIRVYSRLMRPDFFIRFPLQNQRIKVLFFGVRPSKFRYAE
jgi:hypothetical protein